MSAIVALLKTLMPSAALAIVERLRTRRTVSLIERAYDCVAAELAKSMGALVEYGHDEAATLGRLAGDLGIEARLPTPMHEPAVQHAVWRPVAQNFVHAMLPPLLGAATHRQSISIDISDAHDLWRDAVDLDELARQSSLAFDDATIAMHATARVFFESDLFDGAHTLWRRNREFGVQRRGGALVVTELSPTTGMASKPPVKPSEPRPEERVGVQ